MLDSLIKRRRGHHDAAAELDVTPFMNLMIVLTPVLLLSLVFTHTRVIDIDLPALSDLAAPAEPQQRLELTIRADGIEIGDSRGGVIERLQPDASGGIDHARLTAVLLELKRRAPATREISVLLEADVDYQRLVTVLDRVRAYPVVQDGVAAMAELFPDIALGDAPPRVPAVADGVGKS